MTTLIIFTFCENWPKIMVMLPEKEGNNNNNKNNDAVFKRTNRSLIFMVSLVKRLRVAVRARLIPRYLSKMRFSYEIYIPYNVKLITEPN